MTEYSVLIVDDDIWMQRILAKTMESYGFKRTLLASNAFEGISLAVEFTPMLIIMDILMPEFTGIMALKLLKQIKKTKDIPIIMVSAVSDAENLSLSFKYGIAGFVSKPFTRSTIYEKLVNLYGKERLDRISRGEDVDMDIDYVPEEQLDIFVHNEEVLDSPTPDEISESPEDKPSSVSIQPEQLLQHYQEDEKRSIDAIKKILLKSRK
jgi:two-component system, chemotaxis family, chemotaxis protein CheY